MSSDFLKKQMASFKDEVKASSSRLSSGPPRPSSARPTPSTAQSGRSTPLPPFSQPAVPPAPSTPALGANEIYSQPANTGVGLQVRTQVVYAIEYLKTKRDKFLTLDEILKYLSKQHEDPSYKRQFGYFLKNDEKVEFNPAGEGGGTYRFRPLHNIRTADELLAHLQNQTTAAGLSVKDLRDGWPDVDSTINHLAAQDKLLVTRNKKDEKPRMVWPNDPSLRVKIDQEFVDMWRKVPVPETHEGIIDALEHNGQVPASKNRAPKMKQVKTEKKRKKPRRGGKKTNAHMDGLLRDYSDMVK